MVQVWCKFVASFKQKEVIYGYEGSALCPCSISTEEQARHGLSIDTQLDNLRKWASDNGHTIIGEYVDLGVSARKAPIKRPELQRLLGDLDKIELIAFTKLDRWTRNVHGYYDVQEQLENHKVAWTAIHEDYETITANGRLKTNILLAVAENEADRTSERIKVVFDRKIQQGEYIGNRVPFGYSVIDKHLIPNEDADIIRGAYDLYRRTGSIYQVKNYLHGKGHEVVYVTVCRILRNPMYAGRYRDNSDYCEPIIQPEVFDEVQEMLKQRSYRQNQSKRVYLFSGMIRCAYCGKILVGSWSNQTREKLRYRCNYHFLNGNCPNKANLKESVIESFLLDHVAAELVSISGATESPKKKKKGGPDKAAIMAKIDRLKDLYVDGIIEKDQFLSDREKLLSQIPKEPPVKDLSAARRIVLSGDFRERYNELPREDKRALWRSLIDHITADDLGNIDISFFP